MTVLQDRIINFIRKMPKTELHLHLEGAIRAETAVEFIRRNNPSAVPHGSVDVKGFYCFSNLSEFVRGMRTVSDNIIYLKDLQRVTSELFQSLKEQNVRYVEFDCALQKYLDLGFSLGEIIDAITSGIPGNGDNPPPGSYMIVNLQRDHGTGRAKKLVEMVAELNHPFIVGIGLSGDETKYSPEQFTEAFEIAAKAKLHRTAHAGEAAGPESVWKALKHLHVERIDHGTRSIEDDSLVDYLAERKIPLTQCLSSNIRLSVVSDYASHPFFEFYRRGIPVTLNTDDPQVFGVSLSNEYERAASIFGFDLSDLAQFSLNGIRAAFAPAEEKNRIEEEMQKELSALNCPRQ